MGRSIPYRYTLDRNGPLGVYDGSGDVVHNSGRKTCNRIIAKYDKAMEKRKVKVGERTNEWQRGNTDNHSNYSEDGMEERLSHGMCVQLHISTRASQTEGSII